MKRLTTPIQGIGEAVLSFFTETGLMAGFFMRAVTAALRPPYRIRLILQQAEFVGVGSLFIVVLTGTFTGAVFTLQSMQALQRVGMESLVGATVLISVARELGPVLTSLMVTGRVGSAMATELGTMRVTEQLDAMEVMAVDPMNYLVVPRMLACGVMVPVLAIIFVMVAFLGSYATAVGVLGIDEGAFMARIEWTLDPYDFTHGIYKAIFFGMVLALVGCYKGYNASGGARGVGVATTQAVVIGSIAIFILDYVLTSVLLLGAP
jgi:phospholipid/cholesterol/gamma-HCH transport system permease protein